ncbi:MAG: PASTA domain-containing protein [Bacteroidales bacterium]
MTWSDFLKTKTAWKQIGIMFLICIFIVVASLLSLRWFTRHGQAIKVPDFSGRTLEDIAFLEDQFDFTFEIRDSIFDPHKKPGTIIGQSPLPNSTVKKGRNFYLVVAASIPSSINMPNLIDLSFRQASALLETYGLELGNVSYEASSAKNAVLSQTYQGHTIEPGEVIQRGSSIGLVLGSGEGEPEIVSDSSMNAENGLETE